MPGLTLLNFSLLKTSDRYLQTSEILTNSKYFVMRKGQCCSGLENVQQVNIKCSQDNISQQIIGWKKWTNFQTHSLIEPLGPIINGFIILYSRQACSTISGQQLADL